jgi:ribosomal protein L17
MIFIFKTSVKTKMQAKKLKLHIDKILPNAKWNFDLKDRDKILRIDSEEKVVFKIIDLLNTHNYNCEELE